MKKMNIAICDDNAGERGEIYNYIKGYCEKNCYSHAICSFASGEELLAAFPAGAFHMVFLDVYMPGMTGVATARKIRETDPNCVIVFITVSEDHALDAFSVYSKAYLVKPLDNDKMKTALDYCMEQFKKNSRMIKVLKEGNQTIEIPMFDIQYVEVNGRSTRFHTCGELIETHMPLKEIEAQLCEIPFLRCFRWCIVNMNYIAAVGKREFIMQNGDTVPISRDRLAQIKTDYAQFLAFGSIGGGQQ